MKPLLSLLCVFCLLGATGCLTPGDSPESHFYQLTPDPGLRAAAAGGARERVVLHPVRVAEYLERPEVARREGRSRVRYLPTHRWAAPLAENATNVLYLNLRRLLGDGVLRWPAEVNGDSGIPLDIRLYRLEGTPGGEAELKAGVRIGDREPEVISLSVPVTGGEVVDVVAAQSALLSSLAVKVVERL